MFQTESTRQRELFEVGRLLVTMAIDRGQVVRDAGLLPMAQLDRELRVLAEAARRLPDAPSQLFLTYTAEDLWRQQEFPIPDGNDTQPLRRDRLFQTIVGVDPRDEQRPPRHRPFANGVLTAGPRRDKAKPRTTPGNPHPQPNPPPPAENAPCPRGEQINLRPGVLCGLGRRDRLDMRHFETGVSGFLWIRLSSPRNGGDKVLSDVGL